uniref:BAG domain-containing protein n=1 Tax=Steinernema glaseri TaxID=37863 RepID=A0A1I7ZCB4_9BILA
MDSPKSVVASLLLTIERLSKALESLEQRVTLIERFQFESATTWRKKERTCLGLFTKMTKKINAVEERLDIPKEDAQIKKDQVKKKDKLNQTDNKKTKTVGLQTEADRDQNKEAKTLMDSPKSVIASLLLTIERLSTALKSLEQRVTLIEKFQFESAASWRKKERTCSELFLKMVEKINAVEERLDIPKEDAQIQTDQPMKKDDFNQKDNKKTKTVGSLAGATVGEQSTQTEGCGNKNGDEDKPTEGPARKESEPVDQVCKAQPAVSREDVPESSAGSKRAEKRASTEIKCVKENRVKTTSFPKIRAGSTSFCRVPRLFPILRLRPRRDDFLERSLWRYSA